MVLAAAPATAQSRIAILDATGISVLDTTTGQLRARFQLPLGPDEYPGHISASPDGARLLVTAANGAEPWPLFGVLYVLDAVTGEVMARVPGPASNGKPAVLPDGTHAFSVHVPGLDYHYVDLFTFTTRVYSYRSIPAAMGLSSSCTLTAARCTSSVESTR